MVLGAGLRGGICISLEKELASLGHLFLAKNPDTTPRRADHGGFAKAFSTWIFLSCTSIGGWGYFFWQGKRCL